MGKDNPSKIFYKVGEVSQLVGVESYVLRYWEKMFPQLNPEKDDSGQRIYIQSDIDLILQIKHLLHEERYTIDGAKKRLRQEKKATDKRKEIENNQEIYETLRNVKNILKEVMAILEKK
ncbi:MerR family transcriptional regulator [Candidatus Poribacteria bacterium]|nr:MerR family transcriptional regulator [Candidatus Poribacteria bacterium]